MTARQVNAILLNLLIAVIVICSCGTSGDILGTQRNTPEARIIGWEKVDLDEETDLAQPFIKVSPSDEEFLEAHLMQAGGRFRCYYEVMKFAYTDGVKEPTGSKIYVMESDDGLSWEDINDGNPVLVAEGDWEGGFVGAPSVVRIENEYVMYFAGGFGAGIGEARSLDGLVWEKYEDNPVMTPDQDWEQETIGAPAALFIDGKVRVWYSGGGSGRNDISRLAGRLIGHAEQIDDHAFVKSDANGRSSEGDTPNVEPVLTPGQSWEGCDALDEESGFVSSPSVVVFKTPRRRILQMFYTGDEPGEIGHGDASVGFAGSEDGLTWDKADTENNPVVQEIFAIQIEGLSEHLSYDEWGPSVLHRDDRSFMIFTQLDALNWLTDDLKGLAMATNPPIH